MALATVVPKTGPSFFLSRIPTRDPLFSAREPGSFNIRSANLLKPGESSLAINQTSRTSRRFCTRMEGTSPSTPSAVAPSELSSLSTFVTTYISVREAIQELCQENWKSKKPIGWVSYRPAQLKQYPGFPSGWERSCKDECEKLGIDYEKTRAHLEWIAGFASSIAKEKNVFCCGSTHKMNLIKYYELQVHRLNVPVEQVDATVASPSQKVSFMSFGFLTSSHFILLTQTIAKT
jgi:hypothetical protein